MKADPQRQATDPSQRAGPKQRATPGGPGTEKGTSTDRAKAANNGPEALARARRQKRVLVDKDTGSRSRLSWARPDRHWVEPGPEDLARQPAAHRCPDCGYESPYVWNGVHRSWHATHRDPCAECARLAFIEETMAEARAATLRRYQLDAGRYAGMTLERYRPDPAHPSQAAAKEAVRRLVKTWTGGDWSAGIILSSSDVGIGKTHLAIAAAREGVMLYRPRIGERLLAVWDMPSFVDAIRHTYRDEHTPDPTASAQEPVILVLDDVGTEHVTAQGRSWYQKQMFKLVNPRWLACRATIVTTNLDERALWDWLGDRVYSRLTELTGLPVQMRGSDQRLRHLSPSQPKP